MGFLGIFDTVCSAYEGWGQASVSANGGHNGWAHDMRLPVLVEQCVHMTAGHEVRRRFPLDSVRNAAHYPPNAHEICYPGVHADVGGGYAPNEQGRRNTLSRFALNEMLNLSQAGGVRLLSPSRLPSGMRQELVLDDSMRTAFNAYRQALGRSSGTLEQLQAAHMELLHRWLKQRTANPAETEASKQIAARSTQIKQEQAVLREDNTSILKRYRTQFMAPTEERTRFERNQKRIADGNAELRELSIARTDLAEEDAKVIADIELLRRRKRNGLSLTMSQQTMLRAWDNDVSLPPEVARFFDLYTHDSVAHFDYDTSRLTDWRTIYFASEKYSPT